MLPEQRVLIGVINRKKDLRFALDDGWYRIPQPRMAHGIYQEYIGLFVSGRLRKEKRGAVMYFARVGGVELATRRDLIPSEADHRRADNLYYRVSLVGLQPKIPPIENTSNYNVHFIHTTWDRFVRATTITDLYSRADYYVDRIYHALRDKAVRVDPIWETDAYAAGYDFGAGVRVICQNGQFTAGTTRTPGTLFLDLDRGEDALIAQLRAEIDRIDGPVMGSLGGT